VTVYRQLTTLTALLMVALGVAMIGVTIAHGLGVGILLGLLFVAAGVGRLYVLRRTR
jgi:hypothetical protein